ncbi:MAG: rod shape-determining protein MreC [Nitrospirae bacterium]|nr:rod shape-determining protein MreC [Nitrospirota bacterium]
MLKKRLFLFIIFILFIFAALTYQGTKGIIDTSAFDFLSYPLKILEQGISAAVSGIKAVFSTNSEREQRKKLLEQAAVIGDRNQCIETRNENERLKALLDLKAQRSDYVTSARIFARDPTNWFQVLWIDKGSKHGIIKDMIAVTPLGVVGRIHRVLKDRASIIQITDVNASVAVRIQSSRTEGILEGNGDKKCYLKYVSQEMDVISGDAVITSGLEGLYPDGLLIGYVTSIIKKDGEFFQVIEVLPAQDFKTIEEVAILKR